MWIQVGRGYIDIMETDTRVLPEGMGMVILAQVQPLCARGMVSLTGQGAIIAAVPTFICSRGRLEVKATWCGVVRCGVVW